MATTAHEHVVYEVRHTVVTVIEAAASTVEAVALARRMVENGPVDRLSITNDAGVVSVDFAQPSTAHRAEGM